LGFRLAWRDNGIRKNKKRKTKKQDGGTRKNKQDAGHQDRREKFEGEEVADFRELRVYQEAFELALAVYVRARRFPPKESAVVVSQLRRAALSVALNVAEGYGRRVSQKDFTHFVTLAIGSVNETEVLLDFALRLEYLSKAEHAEFIDKYTVLLRRLKALFTKLRQNS
jgi:four helix bundle protein